MFPLLLVIFLYIEASDLIDGYIARRQNLVTDMGKVLDPFSDIISRVSYFLVFTVMDIMPPLSFLIILYQGVRGGVPPHDSDQKGHNPRCQSNR